MFVTLTVLNKKIEAALSLTENFVIAAFVYKNFAVATFMNKGQ
jgi:hypothetical protein